MISSPTWQPYFLRGFTCKVSRKRGCLQLFCYEVYDFIMVDLYTVTNVSSTNSSLPRLVIWSPHSAGTDQIIEAIFVGHQVTISDKLFRILMSGFRRFFKLSIHEPGNRIFGGVKFVLAAKFLAK